MLLLLMGFSMSSQAQGTCAGDCHIIKPYEQGVTEGALLSAKHTEVGLSCVDCHEQTEAIRSQEATAYANGDYDDPMYTREFENDFCFRCHQGYEVLAQRTKHLEEKWGINPHHSHLDAECYQCHKSHQPSTLVCAECHTADWEQRLPEGWVINN